MNADLHPGERATFDRLHSAGDVGPIFQPAIEPRVFDAGGRSYIVLGSDLGTSLALDQVDRSVVSIDPSVVSRRFVNSSLDAFAESLFAVTEFWAAHTNDADADYESAARDLRERIAAFDSRALGSDEAWWSLVVEQIERGLL